MPNYGNQDLLELIVKFVALWSFFFWEFNWYI